MDQGGEMNFLVSVRTEEESEKEATCPGILHKAFPSMNLVPLLSPLMAAGICLAATNAVMPPRVLVYTRNGSGFVHDNIAASVKAIEAMGPAAGFTVDATNDPCVFTDVSLRRYRAIVFCNSNNEAFTDDAQREAFQRFIRAGGGFAGIHSACGSERQWPWFWMLLGGTFASHPPLQPFTIRIVDRTHPSTSFFTNDTWQWEDEFYFLKERSTNVHVLIAGDIRTLKKPGKLTADLTGGADLCPLAWYQEFEGGRSWYTALGHKPEQYKDPLFVKHIQAGICWAAKLDQPVSTPKN